MLVRAWWCYEASVYINTPSKVHGITLTHPLDPLFTSYHPLSHPLTSSHPHILLHPSLSSSPFPPLPSPPPSLLSHPPAPLSFQSFFSDSVLAVLLCSIFNQYHTTLHHPLQVFAVFLAEYSDFNWTEGVVTLQGIVPFCSGDDNENQPWMRRPQFTDLVTPPMAQKHYDFYHMLHNGSNAHITAVTATTAATVNNGRTRAGG